MVHAFKYCRKGRDYHFLWDVESGSLNNVDKSAYTVAKNRYGTLSDTEKQYFDSLDSAAIAEINSELDELERGGCLNSPPSERPVTAKPYGTIKALCLHICHDCNLRCRYCFAHDGTYDTARDYMSYEVGRSAVDFLIANSGNRTNLEIDFFGGEPLMNIDVVKAIVKYARTRETETGKKFSFTITTNCVLLNDELIEYFNKEMHNVVLSIDGRRTAHDNVRKTVNGKGSYDVILNNAVKLAKARGDKSYYVRGTFTRENLDFTEDVKCLREVGFDQISLEPVVLEAGNPLALTDEDIDIAVKEYERLAEYYLDSRKGDNWFNFFHFMLDLENGPCVNKRLSGCGAGCEYLAVTPTGDIYPCHQFAGDKENLLGNVLNGDYNLSGRYSHNIVNNKVDCATCPAKYYCSGGCMANNIHYAGDMNTPYSASCKMMRKRFELSLAIAAIELCGETDN